MTAPATPAVQPSVSPAPHPFPLPEAWVLFSTLVGVLGALAFPQLHTGGALPCLLLLAGAGVQWLALRSARRREAAVEFTIGSAMVLGIVALVSSPFLLVVSIIGILMGGSGEAIVLLLGFAFLVGYVVWGVRRLRVDGRPGSTGGRAVVAGLAWPLLVLGAAQSRAGASIGRAIEAPLVAAASRVGSLVPGRGARGASVASTPGSPAEAAEQAIRETLSSLAGAQEEYFTDHDLQYATSIDSLGPTYTPAAGVTVTLLWSAEQRWAATARHPDLHGRECRVANGPSPATVGWPEDALNYKPWCVAVAPPLPLDPPAGR